MHTKSKYRIHELLRRFVFGCTICIFGMWIASYWIDFYRETEQEQWGVRRGSLYFDRDCEPDPPPQESVDWGGGFAYWGGGFVDGPNYGFDAAPRRKPLWRFRIDPDFISIFVSLLLVLPPIAAIWIILAIKSSRRRRRIRNDLCMQCGYPMLPLLSPACSECGMPRDEQLIARRAFIDAHCGRRWRSAIRMIVGVFLMLIVIGSITGWLFCESKAWIHSETHIGISSGWFVYERDPTDEIYTCFKDDTFLEFEEWLADHWLMWNDFGGGHQIILHLPTIALFAGLFLGAVIASSVIYAKRRTTLTHALTNLENNCVS